MTDREDGAMQRLRSLSLALLAVLALSGLAAAAALITDPAGARLRLTVEDLPGWVPGADWLVPGVVVAVLFGLLPLVAAVRVFRWSRGGWTATAAVGLLLFVFSVALIGVIGLRHAFVQAAALIVGVALTGLGVDGGTTADREDAYADADEKGIDVWS
ncbi:hypothetical protein [Blastococcus sp. PRF04-17]|uniref:hypothetical protein n=1 Tax=Blastococcus sp. PRF04-17 TaxID=2933797 RepID=UPI001FF2CBC2|nr:hypothetical protein [Blastococcus sp. PRF04-17]UOY01847.1 hypothetical protein MVA48_00200 [Blastococcus sp. PRF04-17]